MGEVHRARDGELRRDVAIKILLAEFAGDAERLKRFAREAMATAALNHPSILALYDVGAAERVAFVVSELLEGNTLRDLMARGPLPSRRALKYATQIADGLAAAHAKGIVHRDLKPANIFVTTDDRIKILDFGLARILHDSSLDTGLNGTTTGSLTAPGTLLGSAGYMAPEQIADCPPIIAPTSSTWAPSCTRCSADTALFSGTRSRARSPRLPTAIRRLGPETVRPCPIG